MGIVYGLQNPKCILFVYVEPQGKIQEGLRPSREAGRADDLDLERAEGTQVLYRLGFGDD